MHDASYSCALPSRRRGSFGITAALSILETIFEESNTHPDDKIIKERHHPLCPGQLIRHKTLSSESQLVHVTRAAQPKLITKIIPIEPATPGLNKAWRNRERPRQSRDTFDKVVRDSERGLCDLEIVHV